MVVRQVPRIVQGFLSAVSDQLGGPQVRHLNRSVTALLLIGSAKLKTLARAVCRIGSHRTSLGHFLSRAFWPESATARREREVLATGKRAFGGDCQTQRGTRARSE
jgi:hypothetical protein